MTVTAPIASRFAEESVLDLVERLFQLLSDAKQEVSSEKLPDATRERVADIAEAIRRRTAMRAERDPRSLFDLDDRFIDLMDRAEEEAASGGDVSAELAIEITEYLDAFRNKVDRIAGYWRWQESIGQICGEEAERLAARKKAADGRVTRLKSMLLAFMTSRGHKKLEGDKASITKQQNSTPALVIDNPLEISNEYFVLQLQFTRLDIQAIVAGLGPTELRRRLEFVLQDDRWEIDTSAVRAALLSNATLNGARLAKGHHVRIR
jgi:hypothetical protein